MPYTFAKPAGIYSNRCLLNGDYKTPVKIPNPHFDKVLQQESITCATCHIRNGNVIGTTGNTNIPHNTIKDAEFLSEKLCISCHNVVDELSPVLVCTFETGDEWENNRAIKGGKNCITCHMPETERSISPGGQIRKSHYHYFPGSGIPKFYDREVKGLNGLEIRAGSVKKEYAVGEKLDYSLMLKNSFAGHNVPTGDPERFFLITFKVSGSGGKILKQKAYRIGEEWQWYPLAKKLSDNNLKPLEEREFIFEYVIPGKDELALAVEITKHRITKENAEVNGILENYPRSIVVYEKIYLISVKHGL